MPQSIPDSIGRYRVLNYLGGGGMGKLYLAQDPAIDRQVAIKILRDGYDTPGLRERFVREARSAGRLRHPNVVTIFDVGEESGCPFIAMEYVEGTTLEAVIRERQPLAIDRKIEVIEELLSALQYAHKNGVIHRDIKPANLMLETDGRLKVLDFGIARLGASEITQAGVVLGTLNYMAPEQLFGGPIDGRADLFSTGAVFYELLTHRRAFPGDVQAGILHRIMSGQPDAIATIVPGIDPGLVAFINRCLEKSPDQRFADLESARAELSAIKWRLRRSATAGTPLPIEAPGTSGSPPTPRPRREALLRIRAEQFDAHMAEARRALDSGAYEVALDACQRALVLEPESDAAVALEEEAREAVERHQIAAWLVEARSGLERGALTAASLLVERALSLNSAAPDAITLRKAIDEARRKLAEDQARARQFDDAVSRGRQLLAAGELSSAAEAVEQALTIDSDDSGALTLKEDISQAAIAASAAAEAHAVVVDARQRFASGRHDEALALLASARDHVVVSQALSELQLEHRELVRLAEQTHIVDPPSLMPETLPPTSFPTGSIAVTVPGVTMPSAAIETARSPIAAPPAAATSPPAIPAPVSAPQIRRAVALPAKRSRTAPVALAAGVLAVIGAGAWWALQRPAAPLATTPVAIHVLPWARLESVVDTSSELRVEMGPTITPVVLSLAPGAYRVRAVNPNYPRPIEFELTVAAGQTAQEVRYTLPDFDLDAEIERVVATP